MTTVATELPISSAADRRGGAPMAAAAPTELRLNELFRLWKRESLVHPLIHLIRRYRSECRE